MTLETETSTAAAHADAADTLQPASSSTTSNNTIDLTITFRKDVHRLTDLPADTTLATLRSVIQQLTNVEAPNQKLLPARPKGIANLNQPPAIHHDAGGADPTPPSLDNDQRTLAQAGIPSAGLKIMVVGTPSEELQGIQQQEDYARRRNGPRQYHPSMLRGTRPRNTATPGASFSPFGTIQPHASTPASSPLYSKIVDFLTRLANDPGILHICRLYDLRVGILTELLPWESPELLGLNENAGQRVSLRLRTDDAEGFRNYTTTRRVLVHELAHNRYGGHANDFKTFNSELNAQIAGFEQRKAEGTHALVEGDAYDPDAAAMAVPGGDGGGGAAGGRRLGSGSGSGSSDANGGPTSVKERRQRILEATMRRLEKEEQEIEESCGSAR
ncbi:uncharacterized protein PFL1_04771 [Pseudozyma flocculosa PF-1]|uniref:WLM domain-containing protein n=2 Tax=Pseudozyma flocculosa TaxID=84751 RepID=A0A5C3F6D7_9BASI|nr:uncharacterized protein PFL1_04771 [Pseudozyma flocculosa PF-1]EPQ27633.1 hypothetical protein PFL1_04771 [Pseudozyma flocculosa PF-1]SPO39237.1 uncharacterized protein PSFLO_04717 [Pseudozyma flocculosa]